MPVYGRQFKLGHLQFITTSIYRRTKPYSRRLCVDSVSRLGRDSMQKFTRHRASLSSSSVSVKGLNEKSNGPALRAAGPLLSDTRSGSSRLFITSAVRPCS
jgi:hypothetical protein